MLIKKQTILSKKNIKEYLKECIPNYILIAIIGILYVGLLYFLGKENILDLIKFGILIPILFVVFIVDFKIQIIPNRVNLTLFEIGIVFAFIYALMNINFATITLSLYNLVLRFYLLLLFLA